MAVPLIMCRLKEDHSVIAEIGETALVYFPDWEPVPDDHLKKIEELNNTPGPILEPDPEQKQKAVAPKPPVKTKAATAAKDKE